MDIILKQNIESFYTDPNNILQSLKRQKKPNTKINKYNGKYKETYQHWKWKLWKNEHNMNHDEETTDL